MWLEVHKFVHGQSTSYLRAMFEVNDKASGRGHQFRLVLKPSGTRLRQYFFIRRAVGHCKKLTTQQSLFSISSPGHLGSFGFILQYALARVI